MQRLLAGTGEFFAPQEGQLIDEEVFAAAAIADRLGKGPLRGKGIPEIPERRRLWPLRGASPRSRVQTEKTRRRGNCQRAEVS